MPFRILRHSLFRFKASDSYFQVIFRTKCREPLAISAKDRRALNAIATDTLHRFDIKLHAYCLMTHHLRALIEVDERILIEAMRRVAIGYSRHKELKAAGHLFERPYTAQRIESDGDFMDVLRGIHLNPVIANKVSSPDEYPWSSHRSYLGFRSNALITTAHALAILDPDPIKGRAAYYRFIAQGVALNVRPPAPKESKQAAHDARLAKLLSSPNDNSHSPSSRESDSETHIELSTVATSIPAAGAESKQATSRQFLAIY